MRKLSSPNHIYIIYILPSYFSWTPVHIKIRYGKFGAALPFVIHNFASIRVSTCVFRGQTYSTNKRHAHVTCDPQVVGANRYHRIIIITLGLADRQICTFLLRVPRPSLIMYTMRFNIEAYVKIRFYKCLFCNNFVVKYMCVFLFQSKKLGAEIRRGPVGVRQANHQHERNTKSKFELWTRTFTCRVLCNILGIRF